MAVPPLLSVFCAVADIIGKPEGLIKLRNVSLKRHIDIVLVEKML